MRKAVLYCAVLCLYVSLCHISCTDLSADDEALLPRFVKELRSRRRTASVVPTETTSTLTSPNDPSELSGELLSTVDNDFEPTSEIDSNAIERATSVTSVSLPTTEAAIATYGSPDDLGSDLYRMLGDYLGYSWRAIIYNPLGVMMLLVAFAGF